MPIVTLADRVADREQPRVDDADDIAGVRLLDALPAPGRIAASGGASRTLRFIRGVPDFHIARISAAANAQERDAVAVAGIHVGLNLEDEPGELGLVRLDDS